VIETSSISFSIRNPNTGSIDMKTGRTLMAQAIITFVLIACLQGCGTAMTLPESKFLSNYSDLNVDAAKSSSSLQTAVSLDPSRIVLGDIQWHASDEISPEEQANLVSQLRNELQQRIDELPRAPNARPAVLRAAITRVATVSPSLNALATLLILVPIDRGGAAVEIEAIDPDTGKQLVALRLGYFAPMTDLRARFSKLAPATIAVKKAADDFVLLLQPASASLSAL
jgi:Protein of unknown function (DUF3313)